MAEAEQLTAFERVWMKPDAGGRKLGESRQALRETATIAIMTIDERMDRLEQSLGKNDALVRELRDAVTVIAHLEARQGRALKEHGDWLASHEQAMKAHDAAMKAHDAAMKALDAAMKALDERITRLVSGVGAFMRGDSEKNG